MTLAPSVYGPLDDDVALLASDGKVIRRHDGMYRLNGATEKLTAAMVRGMAAEVRNRRLDAATAPRATEAGHEVVSGRGPDDPRARMARHEITERGKGRPPGGRAGTPDEGRAGSSPAAPKCTKCGGPLSKWSKGQCAVCYAQAGRGSYPQRPYAERPDKFWRAVESAQLTSQSHHVGDVSKMVGPDQSVVTSKMLNSDAAPSGRVDAGVLPDVPPAATPQTASAPSLAAVTPAPEYGASAGTHKRSRTRKSRKSLGIPARILALENRNDALERKVAALEALMSMEGLR